MLDLEIRPATIADWPAIAELLRASALPLDGAREHLDAFVIARRGALVAGTAGLEIYGEAALVRSVAVAVQERGRGVARALIASLIALAAQRRVSTLYLLTTTAADYFERLGFRALPRDTAPSALQESAEFRGACPASATFMARPVSTTPAGGR
jgi:N-acetylglutamate synthase-like GNAT family acetyltransferase